MCYRLYLVSPLTLSEIRSMLAEGMTAHLAPSPVRDQLVQQLRKSRDAVEILSGACACDLVGRRLADVDEDERRLREAFRRKRVARSEVIRVLERHRTLPPGVPRPSAGDFGAFVAEHARNAGPALYYLRCSVDFPSPLEFRPGPPLTRQLREVLADPRGWLAADTPTAVLP